MQKTIARKDAQYESRLRGLPAGLLDQPFYGWVRDELAHQLARFNGLNRADAKAAMEARLSALFEINSQLLPSAQSAGLVTLREGPMNRADKT